MGSYTIEKNAILDVLLTTDILDQGWVVSEGIAYHSGCNAGYIDKVFDLSSATQWVFEYDILSVSTGTINIVVDGDIGVIRNTPGNYKDVFNVTGVDKLVRFFSNGTNSVRTVKIYPVLTESNALTLGFNEDANRFISYYGYQPEFMVKHKISFFTFKNGSPWMHNVNPIRNNFYGEQQSSKITFYVNSEYEWMKTFYSLFINSNELWTAANDGDIKIMPNKRKPSGMQSRLKENRFKNIQGKWYADFLRHTGDPRFEERLDALFKGAVLQGNVMEITLENKSTSEVRLISVDITFTKQNFTY